MSRKICNTVAEAALQAGFSPATASPLLNGHDALLSADDVSKISAELNKVTTAERDALRAEVERLREGLMRVHNFPSHPGGHVADRSDDVECPEDWRDGWITAVYLVQEAALSAPIRDSRKTAALSAGEKE